MAILSLLNVVALTLAPQPPKPTTLEVSVRPAQAVFYVDGKRRGSGTHTRSLKLTPGVHVIRAVLAQDEHEEPVRVLKGKRNVWSWEFEDDRPQPVAAPSAPRHVEERSESVEKPKMSLLSGDAANAELDAWALSGRSSASTSTVPAHVRKVRRTHLAKATTPAIH